MQVQTKSRRSHLCRISCKFKLCQEQAIYALIIIDNSDSKATLNPNVLAKLFTSSTSLAGIISNFDKLINLEIASNHKKTQSRLQSYSRLASQKNKVSSEKNKKNKNTISIHSDRHYPTQSLSNNHK